MDESERERIAERLKDDFYSIEWAREDIPALLQALAACEAEREQAVAMIRKMRRLAFGEIEEIDEYLQYLADKVLGQRDRT